MSLPSNSKRKIFDGRYEILALVGRGVDSVVYHGRHITGAAQEVAIKVLVNRDGSTSLTDKLRREALTLVSCRHKYVVRLDDFHSIQDLCYLSMEYAALGDLSKFIATLPNKRLSAEQVALFLRQSLEAVDFVHATGVVHRDLKPENILVLNEKEIRIADFGLALLPGDEVQLDELQKAVGSFDYLAPEVLDGVRYDTLSDLYSLGVCFYEAATGIHPFADAPIAQRLDARRDSRIKPLHDHAPELPAHVAGVISTLMRFSETDRFQSAADALRALEDSTYRSSSTLLSGTSQIPPATPSNNDKLPPERSVSAAPSSPEPSSGHALVKAAPIEEPERDTQTQPANTDATGSRQPNPTEKIDLERIKAIIAKDSQRRSSGSSGSSVATSSSSTTELSAGISTEKVSDTQLAPAPLAQAPVIQQNQLGRNSGGAFASARTTLLITALIRFTGVALAFALLTVGGVYGYNTIFRKSSSGKTISPAATDAIQQSSREGSSGGTDDTTESRTPKSTPVGQLPEGMYVGSITGLFVGSELPMGLLVNQKQRSLTLLVGVEGWIPATVSIESEGGSSAEGPTFRSNGLILKFNQESSSDAITGTVVDVVTGEAGTWNLTK